MKRIKIAQIGTSENSHGNDIWNTLIKLSDVFEIVGYAFPENEDIKFPDRAKAFLPYKRMTVEEILENPEIKAVTVETEEIYLTKYAQMVANSKKALHMEKPGSPDLASFERLIQTLKSNETVFHTGYMYRYNPLISDVLNRIKKSEIGKITCVDAQMSCYHRKQTREFLADFPSGELFFLGCHLIDLIVSILGIPNEILPLSFASGKDGVFTDDIGMAVFKYPNAIATARVNGTELGGFNRRQLVITGETGTIEIKPLEMFYPEYPRLATVVTEYTNDDWDNKGNINQVSDFDRYENMMLSFAQMVRGEKKNPYTYDYELELFKTVMKGCGVE